MRIQVAVDIDACPEHVWAVLTDVCRWPEWATAVREVRLLDGPVMGPGSVLRVRASGLPERTWHVSGYVRHRSFTWSAAGLGTRACVRFRLARPERPDATTTSRTRLYIDHERNGWIAAPVQRATGRTVERHLRSFTEGLARRCEQRRPAAAGPAAAGGPAAADIR